MTAHWLFRQDDGVTLKVIYRLTFYGTTLETGMEHRTGAEPTCCRRTSHGRRSAGLGPHLISYCRLVWHSCPIWPSCLLWHICLIWRWRLVWHRHLRRRRCRDGNTGFGEKGRCEVGRDGVRLVPGQVPEAVPLCVLAKSKQKSLTLRSPRSEERLFPLRIPVKDKI